MRRYKTGVFKVSGENLDIKVYELKSNFKARNFFKGRELKYNNYCTVLTGQLTTTINNKRTLDRVK